MPRTCLLNKLKWDGYLGNLLKWIENFLSQENENGNLSELELLISARICRGKQCGKATAKAMLVSGLGTFPTIVNVLKLYNCSFGKTVFKCGLMAVDRTVFKCGLMVVDRT